jgi:short-subunit dehydrogenase
MAKDLQGKTALVTGASSGIGAAFARLCAERGADVIVTARRAENLEALAKELTAAHGVRVTVIPLDLADPAGAKALFDRTEGAGTRIDIVINNAGGGFHRYFVDSPWEKIRQQIQLNLVTLTELTWLFARAMLARGGGHILNVASIGAYTPSPTYAVYSATKAFVRDMTEAIAHELRDTKVRVCCLCPGGTVTEFHTSAQHDLAGPFRATFMSAEACAKVGLSALLRGRRNIVSGLVNKLMMQLLRFLPRRMIVWMTALTMGAPKLPPGELPAKRA